MAAMKAAASILIVVMTTALAGPQERPGRNVRVLVVDDNRDTAIGMARLLGVSGYAVKTAHDGPSALELVRKRPYRVAVLDYRMPGMDGLTLCREIRARSSGTVAIIVTAYAGGIPPEEFLGAGARRVLRKPVDVRELLDVVQSLLAPSDQV